MFSPSNLGTQNSLLGGGPVEQVGPINLWPFANASLNMALLGVKALFVGVKPGAFG